MGEGEAAESRVQLRCLVKGKGDGEPTRILRLPASMWEETEEKEAWLGREERIL